MKFYEKHTWVRKLLAALVSGEDDHYVRYTIMYVVPVVVAFAILFAVVWLLVAPIQWVLLTIIALSIVLVGWYSLLHFANEAFDPDDFEYPTPR